VDVSDIRLYLPTCRVERAARAASLEAMNRFQFSLANLCILVLFVAVFSAAWASNSDAWTIAVFAVVILSLLAASVLDVSGARERFRFWAAFARCGWGYLLACSAAYALDVDLSLDRVLPLSTHTKAIFHSGVTLVVAYCGAVCSCWLAADQGIEQRR
jgi:hypothetical protein